LERELVGAAETVRLLLAWRERHFADAEDPVFQQRAKKTWRISLAGSLLRWPVPNGQPLLRSCFKTPQLALPFTRK
jgi:hypothetical protein